MRLGRKPHNPVALASAPAHRFGVAPPPVLNRSLLAFTPLMGGNDVYPDCTFVSLTNCARAVAFLNGYDLAVDESLIPAGYAACVGVPDTQAALIATDGAVMLDVAAWQGANGYDIGPQRLVARVGTVANDRASLMHAMARLGSVWAGVTLHERDMDDAAPGRVLDVSPDDGAVVGGHAITLWTASGLGDDDRVWIGTWGYWQPVTWRWIDARLNEAHGPVWRQLARAADGLFYDGLTADGLVAEGQA